MAYVKFFRGPEANLPKGNALADVQEGSFYLTTDTWRLYNAINTSTTSTPKIELCPLGEKINYFHSTATIDGAADHIGEFAYIESGNVFMVSVADGNGAKWVQINTQAVDKSVKDTSVNVTTTNEVATVALAVDRQDDVTIRGTTIDNSDPQNPIITPADFSIAAGKGIGVASSGRTITISKDDTPLTLTGTTDGTLSVDGGSVQIKAGSNITLETDTTNKTITITGDAGGVKDVTTTATANGFNVSVTGANDTSDNDTFEPEVVLGSHTDSPYKFHNGTMTLPVYTKTEIDNSLTGLNAMVYKGTVGSATDGATTTNLPDTTAPTGDNPDTRPQIGDTYKVVTEITVQTDSGSNEAHVGDLIIARGTEGPSGRIESGLVWDIVRAADDVDTTYHFAPITHGTSLMPDGLDREAVGSLVIAADNTYLEVSDSGSGNDKTVTVSHKAKTQAATVPDTKVTQDHGETETYVAVSGVTVDGAGHVTGLHTKELEVVDTTLKADSLTMSSAASTSGSTVTVTTSASFEDTADIQLSGSAAFTMTSNGGTINMSGSGTNVNYDIVWGIF